MIIQRQRIGQPAQDDDADEDQNNSQRYQFQVNILEQSYPRI